MLNTLIHRSSPTWKTPHLPKPLDGLKITRHPALDEETLRTKRGQKDSTVLFIHHFTCLTQITIVFMVAFFASKDYKLLSYSIKNNKFLCKRILLTVVTWNRGTSSNWPPPMHGDRNSCCLRDNAWESPVFPTVVIRHYNETRTSWDTKRDGIVWRHMGLYDDFSV